MTTERLARSVLAAIFVAASVAASAAARRTDSRPAARPARRADPRPAYDELAGGWIGTDAKEWSLLKELAGQPAG